MLICNWIGDLWVAISISCKAPRRRNTRLTSENNWSLFSQCSPATQVGVTKPIFSIPLLFPFFKITKHWLPVWYHVNIWQRSPQLSSGDTCQIWTWLKVSNIYLPYIKISRYGEINERSFSNPHLEHKLSGPHFHRVGMKDLLLVPLGIPRLASPSVRCQSVLDWCRCQSPGRSVQLMMPVPHVGSTAKDWRHPGWRSQYSQIYWYALGKKVVTPRDDVSFLWLFLFHQSARSKDRLFGVI